MGRKQFDSKMMNMDIKSNTEYLSSDMNSHKTQLLLNMLSTPYVLPH